MSLKFKYGQPVRVQSGFYEGLGGVVDDYRKGIGGVTEFCVLFYGSDGTVRKTIWILEALLEVVNDSQ